MLGCTFELVERATIGAFDNAVGFDWQEDTWMAIPSFVFGATAVQRQIFRGDDHGIVLVVHLKGSLRNFVFAIVRY